MESIKMIWLAIIGGAVLLAGGGLFASWGWNRLSSHNQKMSIVRGIAREIQFNEFFLRRQSRLFDSNDDSALDQEGMFPRLRNTATRAALSSGSLDRASNLQDDLVIAIMNYEWTIDYLNRSLDWIEAERARVGGMATAQSIRRNVLESTIYSNFLKAQSKLKEILARNFGQGMVLPTVNPDTTGIS